MTFDIDANGIVNVSARDKGTGKEQQIRIQASGGLSDSDIERMVREAEEHAEEDKKRRELIDKRNNAASLVHATEKALGEHGETLEADDRTAIETAIADLKGVIEGEDAAAIDERTQALQAASMKLGEAMYKSTQAEQAPPEAPPGGGADETVVDAEFEEVRDDDKRSGSA